MSVILLIAIGVLAGVSLTGFLSMRRRRELLARFAFPGHIAGRVQAVYPHLSAADCAVVMDGLRQFLAVALAARGGRVAMPSQAVDVAWHEFILSTRDYQDFCRRVLGRFLHHTPAEALTGGWIRKAVRVEGLRRAWALACRSEGLDPKRAARLPLLFAIDGRLAIPGGFIYALDCKAGGVAAGGAVTYCAADLAPVDGGCTGGSCLGDGGGDGGGCGGD